MVIDYGPDGVWQEHRRRLLAAALTNSNTLSDDLEDWEQQQQQQQDPRRASHTAQGTQLQGQSGPSFPAAPAGLSAQRRRLFPQRRGGSPGLHRAVIPKLYAIDSWRPRLCSQLLPKYLLSFDGACTAHLYRNLGRLQPTKPGQSQVSKSTPRIPSQLRSRPPDAVTSAMAPGAAAAAAGAAAAGAAAREAGSQTSAFMSPGVAARQAPRPFTQEALSGLASQEQAAFALMVKAVGAAITPKLPDFGADALTAIPLGLAECGVPDIKLLMVWEKVVTAKVVAWPSGHLADLALGLGALGLVPEPALRVAYYGAVLKRLPRFRPQQLADLLRGFAALAQPCMQRDTQPLPESHEQAACIDKHGLQQVQGEPSSLHPGSTDGSTNKAVEGEHIPEPDATAAAACLAGKKLFFKLLSTARRMLTSSPPVSGTHCTAVIIWAAATGMPIPPSWMEWYSQYIRETLVQRPGLLGFRDQVAILEALARMHGQRHTTDRSMDITGSLKLENGSVGNLNERNPLGTQASESSMLTQHQNDSDTAVEELVQALVSELTGSASEQRVPAPLLARVCRALRQLSHTPPSSLVTAAVVSTMRHMSVLSAAQVADVAGALRAWGVKPPAAWSAAALVHTQQRHVLQACSGADLAVLVEMLPMLSGVPLPVQWFEAFLGELLSRCDGGMLGQRLLDSGGKKVKQGEKEKSQEYQQNKDRHRGWDNRDQQEGDSIRARSSKGDVWEVQEERPAGMEDSDGSGPQPQQQDIGHPSRAGMQQPPPQEAAEELAFQPGRLWSWVKPDADRREITGDQLGMLLITLMNMPGANETMSLLARQQPALMEAVMQLSKHSSSSGSRSERHAQTWAVAG